MIFIAGTDTNIGKTIITGLLARFLQNQGFQVITQKWIQTGTSLSTPDMITHLKFMKKNQIDFEKDKIHMSPIQLQYPASPHLAAQLENTPINIHKIKKSMIVLKKKYNQVIIEGIGGLMVPLNSQTLLIDLIKELKLQTILVISNKLGAINHALLSIEALRKRKINCLGLIINNCFPKEDPKILADNIQTIQQFSNIQILGTLPYEKNKKKLISEFKSIGEKILQKI